MMDGVFAFAILDTKKRELYLGRDIFGVRPMFTFHVGGEFNGNLVTIPRYIRKHYFMVNFSIIIIIVKYCR